MLPSDVLGVSVWEPKLSEFVFKPGPLFTNIVLADEINRTTPKTQSSLLEAMNEAQVSLDHSTYPLPRPFMVLATQNPREYEGTYPLPESQLDRFLLRIRIGYPEAADEKEVLRGTLTPSPARLAPVLSVDEVLELQEAAEQVKAEESVLDYLVTLVTATRRSPLLALGVSPRGSLALLRAARARGPGRRPQLPPARRHQGAGGVGPRPPRDGQGADGGHGRRQHGRRGGHPRHRAGRPRSALSGRARIMWSWLGPGASSGALFHPRRTIWPTRDGWWSLLVVIGLGVAAINTGNNLLYLLDSLLFGLIVVSGVLSEMVMRGLALASIEPEEIHAGQPAPFGAVVTNHKRWLTSYSITVETLVAPGARRACSTCRGSARAPSAW